MSKVIMITGASRGFGKIWAEALLEGGHKVAATARNPEALADLKAKYGDQVLALQLDVNDKAAGDHAVAAVKAHFGRIDVLINNAGYGLFGAIEETTEKQARDQFETNFFGLLWVTQAVLPVMREQRSGHIIQVSSYLGLVTLPVLGLYNASKFAVEGLSETLSKEVAAFGIRVTLIEPNGFATDWSSASAEQTTGIPAYEPVRKAFFESATPEIFGDPLATAAALVQVIESPNPPLRLLLGKIAYPAVKAAYEERLTSWAEWNDVASAAHGPAVAQPVSS